MVDQYKTRLHNECDWSLVVVLGHSSASMLLSCRCGTRSRTPFDRRRTRRSPALWVSSGILRLGYRESWSAICRSCAHRWASVQGWEPACPTRQSAGKRWILAGRSLPCTVRWRQAAAAAPTWVPQSPPFAERQQQQQQQQPAETEGPASLLLWRH